MRLWAARLRQRGGLHNSSSDQTSNMEELWLLSCIGEVLDTLRASDGQGLRLVARAVRKYVCCTWAADGSRGCMLSFRCKVWVCLDSLTRCRHFCTARALAHPTLPCDVHVINNSTTMNQGKANKFPSRRANETERDLSAQLAVGDAATMKCANAMAYCTLMHPVRPTNRS
jgi:hypothetical protein